MNMKRLAYGQLQDAGLSMQTGGGQLTNFLKIHHYSLRSCGAYMAVRPNGRLDVPRNFNN